LDQLKAGRWEPQAGWDNETIVRNCGVLLEHGRLSGKTLPLACVAALLLAERQPDTVRGTMYAAVSAGWLPDTGKQSYGKIQRLLNNLRRRRLIPFAWIVDNIRQTDKPSSWSGLADFADTVRDAYRKDFWAGLPDYVCIIVEKDAVAGKVSPVTREYDVPLHPLRGYSSTSFAYGIAEQWRRIEKPIHCYYIGDHDPSGRNIEQSIRQRLSEYAEKPFQWKRLAVEPDQFEWFNIIPLDPKKRDTRYQAFAMRYGQRCAEVEAIPADALRQLVREAIESHIPAGQWERLKAIEDEERTQWKRIMGRVA
jgi:hypothetical protein